MRFVIDVIRLIVIFKKQLETKAESRTEGEEAENGKTREIESETQLLKVSLSGRNIVSIASFAIIIKRQRYLSCSHTVFYYRVERTRYNKTDVRALEESCRGGMS